MNTSSSQLATASSLKQTSIPKLPDRASLRNQSKHAGGGDSEQGVFVQTTPNIWKSARPTAAAPWTRVRLDEPAAGGSPMGTDVTEVWTRVCRDQAQSLCFNELTVQATNLVRKFRLSALVFVRANFTRDTMQHQFREVREWMEWLFFSGADHIFLYDHCQFPEECLKDCLTPYIRDGLVTYIKYNPPESYRDAQSHVYDDWLHKYRDRTQWQLTADMDEYPYLKSDIEPNFLLRLTERYNCSIYFQNQFFLDLPKQKREGEFLMERIVRKDRNFERYPSRSKVLYQPEFVSRLHVHTADMQSVCSQHHVIPIEEGGLQHYWGYRHTKGDPNCNLAQFLQNTVPDETMKEVAMHFKRKHTPKVKFKALDAKCRAYDW